MCRAAMPARLGSEQYPASAEQTSGFRPRLARTEQADGPEIRLLESGHGGEIHPLDAGLGNLPGGEHPLRIGIEQERHHHRRVKGWIAFVFHVGVEDRGEVQFLDHEVPDEMGRMPLRDEFGDFRWQQPLLLGVPGPESFGHTYLSYRPCQVLPLIRRFLSFSSKVEHRPLNRRPPLRSRQSRMRLTGSEQGVGSGHGRLTWTNS